VLTGSGFKGGAFGRGEGERFRQQIKRLSAGRVPLATLQGADGFRTQVGALGQFFLRQACGQAIAPQQAGKWW
jgi:hypothetical protein